MGHMKCIGGTILRLGLVILFTGFCGGAQACPQPRLDGPYLRASAQELYEAPAFEVAVEGDFSLRRDCHRLFRQIEGERGEGLFDQRPSLTLETPGLDGYALQISVRSPCDSTLLVNTPRGEWFFDDDDNDRLDARLVLNEPGDGAIDIWVGSADGRTCDGVLTVESF